MPLEDEERAALPFGHGEPLRLLSLSDGVFAIIMTLLVLDLRLPEGLSPEQLDAELIGNIPSFFAYVAGFLLAGVYWISHRDLFDRVRLVNYPVLWFNFAYLLVAALVPAGTSLIGNYPDSREALALYGVLLVLLATARLALFRFVTSQPHLLFRPMPDGLRTRISHIMLVSICGFALCAALSPYLPARLLLLLYGVTPLIFVTAVIRLSRNWAPEDRQYRLIDFNVSSQKERTPESKHR
jgi:uncharacterized membrane protein